MNTKKLLKKGFTLVELIIVIAIIAILAVTAFLLLTKRLSKSRDASRNSNLANIEKSLQISLTDAGTLPKPDNYTLIYASGTSNIIGYQGDFGEGVKDSVGNINSAPKDGDDYFVYYLSNDLKSYQIGGFMENEITYNSNVVNATDYSSRYINVRGFQLGMLFDSSNSPVNKLGLTGVDIQNTTSSYKAYFDNTTTVTGTGQSLRLLKGGSTLGYGLVGYWDFDEDAGTGKIMAVTNKSVNKINSLIAGVSLTGGKQGTGLYLSGQGISGFLLSGGFNLGDFDKGFTLSMWVKSYNNKGEFLFSSPTFRYHSNPKKCFDVRLINTKLHQQNLITSNFSGDMGYFYVMSKNCVGNVDFSDSVYHLNTISFTNSRIMVYVDGQEVFQQDLNGFDRGFIIRNYNYYTGDRLTSLFNSVNNGTIGQLNSLRVNGYMTGYDAEKGTPFSSFDINLGLNGGFRGYIDDLRIYDRALTESEVKILYDTTK